MRSTAEGVKSMVRPTGLPLVGHVAAGQPVLAEENIEDYVDVPAMAGGGKSASEPGWPRWWSGC